MTSTHAPQFRDKMSILSRNSRLLSICYRFIRNPDFRSNHAKFLLYPYGRSLINTPLLLLPLGRRSSFRHCLCFQSFRAHLPRKSPATSSVLTSSERITDPVICNGFELFCPPGNKPRLHFAILHPSRNASNFNRSKSLFLIFSLGICERDHDPHSRILWSFHSGPGRKRRSDRFHQSRDQSPPL